MRLFLDSRAPSILLHDTIFKSSFTLCGPFVIYADCRIYCLPFTWCVLQETFISNLFWTVYEASPGSFVSVGFVHSVICQKIPVLDEFMCYSKLCCGNSFIVAKQRDSTGKLSSLLMSSILRNSINLS